MTRQDFALIADAIADARYSARYEGRDTKALDILVVKLGECLKITNPQFDKARFSRQASGDWSS